MKPLACFLILLALPMAPAGAQQPSAEAVMAAWDSLAGQGEQREIYALPPVRYWRAEAPQTVTVAGGRALNPAALLAALAGDMTAATGVKIAVRAEAEPGLPERRSPDSLHIVIAGRPLGTRLATEAGIDAEMRRRFHDGGWPALVGFRRDDLGGGARSGIVILADDLPQAELEALLAVSVVWAMGGASLGEELAILEPPGGRPGLTELGRRVFALMYHPDLRHGMRLDEARARARTILGLPG